MRVRQGLTELIAAYARPAIDTTLVHYGEEHDSTDAGIRPFIDGLPDAAHVHLTQGTRMGFLEQPKALSDALLHRWSALETA